MPGSKAFSLFIAAILVTAGAGASIQAAAASGSSSTPYLSLAVQLANKLHRYMLDGATGVYYSALSDNWLNVSTTQFTTLGNAFIDEGMVQLYRATGNHTYLTWAANSSNRFWERGWDSTNGGFYDVYGANWSRADCQQVLQDNAMFLVVFVNLYATNGSAVWLQRANSIETLLNGRFWSTTDNIAEVSYDVCTHQPSGDVNIEQSIGSYLWATAQWTTTTGNTSYVGRMGRTVSFAMDYLWDNSTNTLMGGGGCAGAGYQGFMRSVYANLTRLEDCRKGANENIWGAVGLAYYSNLEGNATVRAVVNRDLAWINRTLWDSSIGGYHNDVFRNDTLRSSCASTNDPRDYPGWTQGEQPMFWWQIGGILGNTTQMKWALVAEEWTATHQWNSTGGNGGLITCLDSNALPDPGSTELYDWIQGSSLYSFSTLSTTLVLPHSTTTSSSITVTESTTPSKSSGGTTVVSSASRATSSVTPSSSTSSVTLTTSITTPAVSTSQTTSETASASTTSPTSTLPSSTTYVALIALAVVLGVVTGVLVYRRRSPS